MKHIPAYTVQPPLGNDQSPPRLTVCEVGLPWVFLAWTVCSTFVGGILGFLLARSLP